MDASITGMGERPLRSGDCRYAPMLAVSDAAVVGRSVGTSLWLRVLA